ncbi:MAG: SAM-dependent methyltransferase [Elusimicrobiota bacterium]|nr:SAM-dependent methyltransferase [Elusimicrobiota bacterium]
MEKLIICGLGVRVPEEITLESLQALADCRVVYCDLEDKAARAWLKGYCRELKFPGSAEEVVRDAVKAGGVGLAVWGQPQFSSRLARETELAAVKAGVAYRVFGAISPIGSVFARSVSFLGGDYGYQGIQAYSVETLLADEKAARIDLPLVLYAEKTNAAEWATVLERLAGAYPKGHQGRMFASDGPETKGMLSAMKPSDSCVLLIPPVVTAAPRAPRR